MRTESHPERSMDKNMKTPISFVIGTIIGILLTLVWIKFAQPHLRYFSAPTVTVINATGETMQDVQVSLGNATADIGELRKRQKATVSVYGEFGESSTHIDWTDSEGRNNSSADDYMENRGTYQSTVVITSDKQALAIY
ncbi:hypothetical protein P4C99_21400 [Pontiellaceae bacterium B1224]|nr:hypothetical protein [Pontiellaceae bacterium B1224]